MLDRLVSGITSEAIFHLAQARFTCWRRMYKLDNKLHFVKTQANKKLVCRKLVYKISYVNIKMFPMVLEAH